MKKTGPKLILGFLAVLISVLVFNQVRHDRPFDAIASETGISGISVSPSMKTAHILEAQAKSQPPGPDERFYLCLERLIYRNGPDHHFWPAGPEKQLVADYLKKIHGLSLDNVVFARNMLGLGVGGTPEYARDMETMKEADAWGIPYDLVLASSRGDSEQWDMLQGIAINQGLALFNPELARNNYVVLKADLHSQFGDVFKNFNGISIRIIAREVNFLGAPGSAADDYADQIRPALTAADSLHASIYTCDQDRVPMIIPKLISEMAENLGFKLPMPSAPRRPMGPMKPVEVTRIELNGCSHDLDEYKAGMKQKGTTMLHFRVI